MSSSLYRKWRPQSFDELKGQDAIRDTLVYAITNQQFSHAYLFCGPRGTGKTTTARLVAKLLNCTSDTAKPCNQCQACITIAQGNNVDVIELDGASNRGIDEIRTLRETVKYPPTSVAFKVFIIDEVHMLTREAFNALLKTLEEPPTHVVFILATTEAHKVPATVLSRVQRFDFRLAETKVLADHLLAVAKSEGMKLDRDGAQFIAALGQGSFRDALTLLEQVKATERPNYTLEVLEQIFGYVPSRDVEQFGLQVLTGKANQALASLDTLLAQGADLRAFGDQVLTWSHSLLESLILTGSGPDGLKIGVAAVIEWIEAWAKALQESKACPIPRLPFDVAIVKFAGASTPSLSSQTRSDEVVLGIRDPVRFGKIPAQGGDDKGVGGDDKKEVKVEVATLKTENSEIENLVSVPVLAEVPEQISPEDWTKMLESVKSEAPSLLTSLAHARVLKMEGDVVHLAVPYKMHADKINTPKNRTTIETAVTHALGIPLKVVAEVNKEASKPEDDLVDVAEVFELEL